MNWKWLPNAITLSRCVLAIFAAWAIVYASPLLALGLFVFVAATDFVDGYLARRLNAVSAFGAFLDPIADKILVAFCLLALCWVYDWPAILLVPSLLIIARDLIITLIRLRPNVSLPVSRFAKWKTAAEMAGISVLLIAPLVASSVQSGIQITGFGLIILAAFCSVWTGSLYVQSLTSKKQNGRT